MIIVMDIMVKLKTSSGRDKKSVRITKNPQAIKMFKSSSISFISSIRFKKSRNSSVSLIRTD